MFVPGSIPKIILSIIGFVNSIFCCEYMENSKLLNYICAIKFYIGALAHLARACDWQSQGDEFDSRMLH